MRACAVSRRRLYTQTNEQTLALAFTPPPPTSVQNLQYQLRRHAYDLFDQEESICKTLLPSLLGVQLSKGQTWAEALEAKLKNMCFSC